MFFLTYKTEQKLCSFILFLLVIMTIPTYAFANTPDMILGTLSETNNTSMDILRALRGAIFVALAVMCFKGLKTGDKLAIAQTIWLITTAGLSIFALNTDRYVGVPDFSYFSMGIFALAGLHIYASLDYLRRILIGSNKSGLFDNMILVISVLCIAILAIIGMNNPILAADILLLAWSITIIGGTIFAIYYIVDKSADIDLSLLGWIPAHIGFIVALGVGTNGGVLAVIISITAWSSVILAHTFLAFLTYWRFSHNVSGTMLQTAPLPVDDSVSLIVDKAVFRLSHDKQKIILNEACAKMLHISGRKADFSIEAFKGLVASEYHSVIDKMLNQTLTMPEIIKFHSCNQKGILHPLHLKTQNTDSEILFLYQEMSGVLAETEKPVSTVSIFDNLPKTRNTQERRKTSDMMYFIDKITDTVTLNRHISGDYVLLLLKIKYYDDWQVTLGVSQSYHLVQQITDMVKDCLTGFDALVIKHFNGDMIGVFCHLLADNSESEYLKEIIYKQFETPISFENNNIFVNFQHGIAKIDATNALIDTSKESLTHLVTDLIDSAKRMINLYPESSVINVQNLLLPQGSNLIQLSTDLRYAPERGQINAYYAPIIDLKKGDTVGFNISPVWRHPDFGVITDDLLAYLSERCTMENTLNRLVLAKAIEGMVKLYRSQNLPIMNFTVSRNLVLGSRIDEEIKSLCDVLKITPSLFRLEFASECLSGNPQWLSNVLSDLKSIGVTTVLNGFGSAKGQLSSLANLPFDRVIIDSGFADNIVNNERKFFALKSLTNMLKNMAIKADIKNVTSRDSLRLLFDAGISNISGSVIGPAVPAERAVNLLTKNREVHNIAQ